MSLSHNVLIVRLPPSVIAVLLLMAVWLEPASAAPARLRVTVDGNSVRIGSKTQVVLTFFDRDFRPVENDEARSVRFEILSTGAASEDRADSCQRSGRDQELLRHPFHRQSSRYCTHSGDIGRLGARGGSCTCQLRSVIRVRALLSRRSCSRPSVV